MKKGVPEEKQKSCKNCWYSNKKQLINPTTKDVTEGYTCTKTEGHNFKLKNLNPCSEWESEKERIIEMIIIVIFFIAIVIAFFWWLLY